MRASALLLSPLLVLLLALSPTPFLAGSAHADTACATTVQSFFAAMSSGDLATAQQSVSPSLTVTLPNGLTLPLAQIAGSLPLTTVLAPGGTLPSISATSVSVEPDGTVDATLGADSGQTTQARFQCSNGQISSIQLLSPAS